MLACACVKFVKTVWQTSYFLKNSLPFKQISSVVHKWSLKSQLDKAKDIIRFILVWNLLYRLFSKRSLRLKLVLNIMNWFPKTNKSISSKRQSWLYEDVPSAKVRDDLVPLFTFHFVKSFSSPISWGWHWSLEPSDQLVVFVGWGRLNQHLVTYWRQMTNDY